MTLRYRISVSQINQAFDLFNAARHPDDLLAVLLGDGCIRKWAYRYFEKVPKLPSDALTFGILTHSCLHDSFTLKGRGEWAKKWPPEYTKRGDWRAKAAALSKEMRVHAPYGQVVSEMTCFDDWHDLDTSCYIKPDLHTVRKDMFVDWKTTASKNKRDRYVLQHSSFYMGGRVPAEAKMLSEDPQARIYANALMKRWGKSALTARWVYGSKAFGPGGVPATWTVSHTFKRAETAAWVRDRIWPVVRLMNGIRQAWMDGDLTTSQHLPHNPKACREVGRFCDSLAQCQFKASPIPMKDLLKCLHSTK